jgi:hypothetical protein
MKSLVAAALILAFSPACPGAPKWVLKYFYDEDKSSFEVNDVSFPSPATGIAVGILEGSGSGPASLVTRDGGTRWELEKLKEPPLSLSFLNDSLGWMVTGRGIWRTEEAGRNWKKVSSQKDVLRVRFLTPERGFAAGTQKSVWTTEDGGKTWIKLPAAAEPKSNPDYTAYIWIEFATPEVGLILGWHRAPRWSDRGLPDWIDPDAALLRRERPSLSLTLETRDGGRTWRSTTSSLFGRISRVRMLPDGRSLGLIEMTTSLGEWPSEVHLINWRTGKSERVFRDKQVAITDVLMLPSGTAFLAGIRHPGQFKRGPIPGKLTLYSSRDMRTWTPMEVDYRATGRRAMLAAAGENDAWVATDTGMFLKLNNAP